MSKIKDIVPQSGAQEQQNVLGKESSWDVINQAISNDLQKQPSGNNNSGVCHEDQEGVVQIFEAFGCLPYGVKSTQSSNIPLDELCFHVLYQENLLHKSSVLVHQLEECSNLLLGGFRADYLFGAVLYDGSLGQLTGHSE